ncbi:MAG: HlyD family efflux transporter periplasmic adaptor subunit [Desulfobacteraceae bacterium]|nr:HlyD family efflux transporter periplasmic adaptor subunit [Desulfobacteraceae bacterium]
MKKVRPILIVVALIIIAIVAWRLFFGGENRSNTIKASGNIEITEVQLSFKIAGRLKERFVDEGDSVFKGELLARLENEDQKIALRITEANFSQAKSVLAELVAGNRPEDIAKAYAQVLEAQQSLLELTRGSRSQDIKTAVSDLKKAVAAAKSARVQLTQAKDDYERFSMLYKSKSATQRDFALYKTQYQVAQNNLSEAKAKVNTARQALSLQKEGPRTEQIGQAKAALAQTQAEYDLVKAGPRQEKIDQANDELNEAEQNVNQAKQQLSYTELFAPMDGIILTKSAEPGEYLNPSTPVVNIGDITHPWLRAFINEKDLGRVNLKDKVIVTTDSFPDKKYQGVLSFISSEAEFTPKAVQTFEERVKLMFRIKINLANPQGELKPGMPADAIISLSIK